MQFGSPFRRPMGGSSGSGGSSKGKTGTNGKTPLSGGSSKAKHGLANHGGNSDNCINVFRFMSDLKIPMRTAAKDHHQTIDENMPSGLAAVPLYPSSERKTKQAAVANGGNSMMQCSDNTSSSGGACKPDISRCPKLRADLDQDLMRVPQMAMQMDSHLAAEEQNSSVNFSFETGGLQSINKKTEPAETGGENSLFLSAKKLGVGQNNSTEQAMEEEETRSVTAPEPKAIQADLSAQLNFLNTTTNNFFEMSQTSSLLVESGPKPGGLFAQGDRFIPCRSHDDKSQFQGVQKFYHEENVLLSRQARKQQRRERRRRRDSSLSQDDQSDSRSRDSSRDSLDSSEETSATTHAQRQQRQNYSQLLQESCFGGSDENNLTYGTESGTHFENLSEIDTTLTTGPPSSYNQALNISRTRGPLRSHHSSTINQRSKGILRFKKPSFKKQRSNIDNEKQRAGLASILRQESDVQMTSTDST